MLLSWAARAVLVATLACGVAACSPDARTQDAESRCLPMYRFLVPEGYVGWIRVDFNAKDAPALPVEGDHLVFRIPESGYLRTPAKYLCGWPHELYYYSGDSRRQLDARRMMRWNGFAGGGEPTAEKEMADYIFIGTEDEFSKYGRANRDAQGVPRYGRFNSASRP